MLSFMKKIIGEEQDRKLKKYRSIVEEINQLEPSMKKLSDDELKNKTNQFQERLENGETLDDLKTEAFAVVREASERVLGLRHYDVQLIGGLAINDNNISEMATGEGKTLVASLPSYLRALEKKGVHVITVNEYLARRDRDLIGKVHEFLGLTVGLNVPNLSPAQKKQAYLADITYGIGSEFGFDFLRDNMVYKLGDRVCQRPYNFAIIDEIDSVLIDEAKTPLIIAGKTTVNPKLYHICAKVAKSFKENEDYIYDREARSVNFTDQGITKIERSFGIDNLYDLDHQTLYHFVLQGLRARVMFERDVDYIVDEGQVKLVDMYTGRIMEGRTLSDGLHQAIEAKEGLEITEENKTQATITIQNFFRMYNALSGMTGTAKTEEKEFQMLYNMHVIQIPTNKPKIREDYPDQIYRSVDEKYLAVAKEVAKRHEYGQPVLVGTTSIIQSETVARYLDEMRLPYEILNAKSIENEVKLISLAGQKNQITIATNMAGRGTDIMLGEGVSEVGGLHVLGTEKHESRRIDNQLRGRSGRQGDPGSSQFFLSIEDDMMKRFARDEVEEWQKSLTSDENGLILDKEVSEFVEGIQRLCEDANYAAREYTLKLDDIVNSQRHVIYELRNKVLESEEPLSIAKPMIESSAMQIVDQYCPDYQIPEEWSLSSLNSDLNHLFIHESFYIEPTEVDERKEVVNTVKESAERYISQIEAMDINSKVEAKTKQILLMTIDMRWLGHLDDMTRLKEGIGLRSYSQEDPMRIYQREGYELFEKMYASLEKDVSMHLTKVLRPLFDSDKGEK
ncbi:accessory Sec system translocase SecA2 [Texcoconibacillus texcoconensis]|uniref:Protein translocase subunit SecA n=1 Tax=Texcoconibacillus texcoconensis TaxID=1095777 RepID=A0A840QQR5_9BACI|nr:accessory Sec system translocase SecA2 [Texcoconibacillus texcoconensis]MBB5173786.1 preprotein translocase subunit SecA [Texcoconibacillus texcoconensis]